jgi:hypothetical protein
MKFFEALSSMPLHASSNYNLGGRIWKVPIYHCASCISITIIITAENGNSII